MKYFYFILFLFISSNSFAEEQNTITEDLSFDKSYTEKGITLGAQSYNFDIEPDSGVGGYSEFAAMQMEVLRINPVSGYNNSTPLISNKLKKYTHFRNHRDDDFSSLS